MGASLVAAFQRQTELFAICLGIGIGNRSWPYDGMEDQRALGVKVAKVARPARTEFTETQGAAGRLVSENKGLGDRDACKNIEVKTPKSRWRLTWLLVRPRIKYKFVF